jgi:hypothetical protein
VAPLHRVGIILAMLDSFARHKSSSTGKLESEADGGAGAGGLISASGAGCALVLATCCHLWDSMHESKKFCWAVICAPTAVRVVPIFELAATGCPREEFCNCIWQVPASICNWSIPLPLCVRSEYVIVVSQPAMSAAYKTRTANMGNGAHWNAATEPDEFEVTRPMIEAGMVEYASRWRGLRDADDDVTREMLSAAYRAMLRLRS